MKFALSLFVIGLIFYVSRYLTNIYVPEHEFLVGWFAGTIAMIVGQTFD